MIVQPFNFVSRLRQTSVGFDLVPFIDACLVAVFLSVLASKFVVAPGFPLTLPEMKSGVGDAIPTSHVLTVGEIQGQEMLMFEQRIMTTEDLEKEFAANPVTDPGEVLLLRLQRDVSVQLQVRILELARAAGYRHVQIAAEPERAASTGFQ